MKLQDFISETLTQILGGIRDAQGKIDTDGSDALHTGSINPHLSTSAEVLEKKGYRVDAEGRTVQNVEFDVAVTVDESADAKASVGLLVAAIGLGAQTGLETRDTTVHRIKFAIPVTLPISRE